MIASLVVLAVVAVMTLRPRVPTSLTCPPGHERAEARPPSGLVAWCERAAGDGPARRDGAFAAWFPDGRRKAAGSYKDGLPHGTFTFWDGSGRKREEGGFQDGREEGPWRRWHASGALQEAGAYRAGVRTGPWVFWFSNGRKLREGEYRDGVPVGAWAHWNPRGDPCPSADTARPADHPPSAAGA
jgi:hypothetical protein